MPTETGTIDLKTQKEAHDSASTTATDFITSVDNDGIWVTPSNAKPSNGSAVSTTIGWHISSVLEYFKQGVSWIKLWVESNVSKLRLGRPDAEHLTLASGGMALYDGEESPFADSAVARFSAEGAVVGSVGGVHTVSTSSGYALQNGEATLFSASIDADEFAIDELFGQGAISSAGWIRANGRVHDDSGSGASGWCWIETSPTRAKPQVYLDMAGQTPNPYRDWVTAEELAGLADQGDLDDFSFEWYDEPVSGSSLYRVYFRVYVGSIYRPVNWIVAIAHQGGPVEIQIGKDDVSHALVDYHSMQLIDMEGEIYFHVSDLRDAEGYITDSFEGDGETVSFVTSASPGTMPSLVIVEINGNRTTDFSLSGRTYTFSAAPPSGSVITIKYKPNEAKYLKGYTFGVRKPGSNIGSFSIAEGYRNTSEYAYTHAEGYETTASGLASHAEGRETTAGWGIGTHAEGYNTTAIGNAAHAEGTNTNANESGSHAEGIATIANSEGSHAQNYHTNASSDYQTAIGKYNVEDVDDTYALIVGNGTGNNARSNAYALTWDGYEEFQSTANKPTMTSAAPSANTAITGSKHYDANGEQVGYSEIVKQSNGNIYRSFGVYNKTSGGASVAATMYLTALKDGTTSASLTSGTKWPIANGGTGATDAAGARTNLGLGTLATKSSASTSLSSGTSSGTGKNSSAISANGGTAGISVSVAVPSGYTAAQLSSVQSITKSGTNAGNLVMTQWNITGSGPFTVTASYRNEGSAQVAANACTVTVYLRFTKVNGITFS